MSNDMSNDLISLLTLERLEDTLFRGYSPDIGWQRIFGGLVIAQALQAASETVEGRAPHSLHGYFILPGDPKIPIIYQVEMLRDGGSFSTRRCTAVQHGRPIFSLMASFQKTEAGLEHFVPAPSVPDPETLPSDDELLERFGELMPSPIRLYLQNRRPIELRPLDYSRYLAPKQQQAPQQCVWLRARQPLPDDPALHRACLAYLSDMTLLDTTLITHGKSIFDRKIQVASLDHALWFHRSFRADEWLLYVQDSPNTSAARGLARGLIYNRQGVLIASCTQEGLIRPRDELPKK